MRLYTYSYNSDFDPPMPIVDVLLIEPHSGETSGPHRALIDSGSDGTLVPVNLLAQIGARSVGSGRLTWLWQESRRVKTYIMELQVGPHRLPAIRVAGVPAGTDLVLGRNVLNRLLVTLNGPAETTELSD
jgi:hypothetical protein